MIMLRAYTALGEAVVEASATVRHDGIGNPTEPRSYFLGRIYHDATSHVSADDLAVWFAEWFNRIEEQVAAEAGGWQALL